MGSGMMQQIKAWLDQQGYPLEMQTASVFRKAGFEVIQSSLYTDQDTAKSREIDVLAIQPDHIGVTTIAFIAECKVSNKPWLLLSDPTVAQGNNVIDSFAVVNRNAGSAMMQQTVFEALSLKCPWFRKNDLMGYSLRNAFSDKDIAHEALMGLAKASFDFLGSAHEHQQYIVFPVLVIDAPLVRCVLDSHGDIQLEEIAEGELLFKADLARPFRTCVRIVTSASLRAFISEATIVADTLATELAESEEILWSKSSARGKYPVELSYLARKERRASEFNDRNT